jgi:hypothetical protein
MLRNQALQSDIICANLSADAILEFNIQESICSF